MVRETESCDPNYLLNINLDDYCEYLTLKYSVEVPTLHENEAYVLNQEEIRKNGSESPSIKSASMLTGEVVLTIAIPFEGNYTLFDCKPSTFNAAPPEGRVADQELYLRGSKTGERKQSTS